MLYGRIMDSMDNQGNISFHMAANSGYLELIELLARPISTLRQKQHVTPPS